MCLQSQLFNISEGIMVMKKYQWINGQQVASGSDSESDEDSKNKVERLNNRIYFYSEIERTSVLALNKQIKHLNLKLINNARNLNNEPASIYLHINSYGGSVFAGLAAVDHIKKSEVPIHSFIDGCAASAATLMSIVAKERFIHEHSFMLIHQLSSALWGKYEEMKDDMKNNDLLMKTIKNIYTEHTKIPKKKLNEILKHDLWFDAKACLEYGLVDGII